MQKEIDNLSAAIAALLTVILSGAAAAAPAGGKAGGKTPSAPTLVLDDLRQAANGLMAVDEAKGKAALPGILAKFKVKKISDIDPKDFAKAKAAFEAATEALKKEIEEAGDDPMA